MFPISLLHKFPFETLRKLHKLVVSVQQAYLFVSRQDEHHHRRYYYCSKRIGCSEILLCTGAQFITKRTPSAVSNCMQSMRLFWDSVPTANHSLIALWRELTLCVLLRPFSKIATGNILALEDCLDFFENPWPFGLRRPFGLQCEKFNAFAIL